MKFGDKVGFYIFVTGIWSLVHTTVPATEQKAEVTTALIILAVAAYAYLYLTRPKPKQGLEIDDIQTTLTTRGSTLQLVIGRREVAPVFAWAGDRIIKQEGGGGGALSGMPKPPKTNVYYESALHLICVGPAIRLHRITEQGKIVWTGPIDRNSHPSGTSVDTEVGTFVIYWGERTQPVNTRMGEEGRLGVSSRWPSICYIEWIEHRLGFSPRWLTTMYEIETECQGSGGVLSLSAFKLAESSEGAEDDGINVAHAMWQLMTAPSPWGSGALSTGFDHGALEVLGVLMEFEHSVCSILAKNDRTAADVIGALMADFGIMLPQIGDVLVPIAIREVTGTPPTFDSRHLIAPDPEMEFNQGEPEVDRISYQFADRSANWKPSEKRVDNDAAARLYNRRAIAKISLDTVIDHTTAQRCANRKQLEAFSKASRYSLRLAYTARDLHPGMPFNFTGLGSLRVMSRKVNTDNAETVIEASLDQYSFAAIEFDPGDQSTNDEGQEPAPDLYVRAIEIPYPLSKGKVAFGVLRIRANENVGSALVWYSLDGESYLLAGIQDFAVNGGDLNDGIDSNTKEFLGMEELGEVGPTVTMYNDDTNQIQDFSSNLLEWYSGTQMILINDELGFLRSVTSLGDSKYTLNGIIRSRHDKKGTHSAGDRVWIFDAGKIVAFDGLVKAGATVYIKTQPNGVNLDDVEAVTLTLKGFGISPYLVDNLGPLTYPTGDDWEGSWTYRVLDGKGNAAGEQLAGTKIQDITLDPDGEFQIEILDPDTDEVLRTEVEATAEFVYTEAMRNEDFGVNNPDSFKVRVTNQFAIGAFDRTITVTKAT